MNTITSCPALAPPDWPAPSDLLLPPPHQSARPVQALDCPAGCETELRVRRGRIWLTREGCPDDIFLAPGQRWRLQGPARLHLSAEGEHEAWVTVSQSAC